MENVGNVCSKFVKNMRQIYGRNGPGGAIDQPVVGVDQAGRGWASGKRSKGEAPQIMVKHEGQIR